MVLGKWKLKYKVRLEYSEEIVTRKFFCGLSIVWLLYHSISL